MRQPYVSGARGDVMWVRLFSVCARAAHFQSHEGEHRAPQGLPLASCDTTPKVFAKRKRKKKAACQHGCTYARVCA